MLQAFNNNLQQHRRRYHSDFDLVFFVGFIFCQKQLLKHAFQDTIPIIQLTSLPSIPIRM